MDSNSDLDVDINFVDRVVVEVSRDGEVWSYEEKARVVRRRRGGLHLNLVGALNFYYCLQRQGTSSLDFLCSIYRWIFFSFES